MTEPLLLRQDVDQTAKLTLNRPERRNALSLSLLQELLTALTELENDSKIRTIVIGANGPAFCAGHDLGEMVDRPEDEYRDLFETCSRVMQKIRQVPQPVIAKVRGMATAAGCQLVAACDLAVATQDARFATPGVKIGLFCTTPMVPLVRAIPAKAAMEMLLTGVPISAERAVELGLINRVVAENELDETVQQYCNAIAATSAMTVRVGKEAFYRQLSMPESDAYKDAVDVMTTNVVEADAQEGISAFLGKRAPQWTQK
ncbi:enoyl-CoA hydratase [Rubinisphaera margarita]|uniref:enoyl-CoA hydratase n=1 Tax=Rubinisphaera margarita TaxID=2909586 RepID=UPI001EE895E4|nr:enoyl-CoA hydratase [Rubinisphaera margarita]MCG6156287.1 enoyl-CoA hydratase [Rubinisphaera margarita]